MAFSPPSFRAPLQDPSAPPTPFRQPPSLSEDSYGVPIARASRDVIVKVKVKQSESLPGPKLEVEGFVGSLHLLISPQQLSMLLEMVTGISNKGTTVHAISYTKLSAHQQHHNCCILSECTDIISRSEDINIPKLPL